MVSEKELSDRIWHFLRSADLAVTTTAAVRRRLEQDFGVDLSDQKPFLRHQVGLFLQALAEEEADDEPTPAEDVAVAGDAGGGEVVGSWRSEGSGSESVGREEEERKVKRARKKNRAKMSKESNQRGFGFNRLCSLSPLLQSILGVSEMARPEVVKQLWVYIRERNLQDPSNRRSIICDETLRELFQVDSINMFQMNKVLSKHIWPFDIDGLGKTSRRRKKKKQEEEEGSDEVVPKEKEHKSTNSGLFDPLLLSDALVKFLGARESSSSRADVVQRIWDYIEVNKLQDPFDKSKILCDDKLKELFQVDSFHAFTVQMLLAPHYMHAEQ